jgi:pyrimidine operon attenuation protein/uracil phosphoribosyltransferase
MNEIQLLNTTQIGHKLTRMAYEVWEKNSEEKEITIIGIEDGGAVVAKNIVKILETISTLRINYFSLSINKEKVSENNLTLPASLSNKVVLLIDDVANSGKTLLGAMKPILYHEPRKIQIAVLVDRKHKNFPLTPDIVGLSVSTTLQEHIKVTFKNDVLTGAFLV